MQALPLHPFEFLNTQDDNDRAPVLFNSHRFCASCIQEKTERVFRVSRRHRFHGIIPALILSIMAI